jgi:hypothetical protein
METLFGRLEGSQTMLQEDRHVEEAHAARLKGMAQSIIQTFTLHPWQGSVEFVIGQ